MPPTDEHDPTGRSVGCAVIAVVALAVITLVALIAFGKIPGVHG
jgi:hypothetical protein